MTRRSVEAGIARMLNRMSAPAKVELARLVTQRRTGVTVTPSASSSAASSTPARDTSREECVCGLPAGHS